MIPATSAALRGALRSTRCLRLAQPDCLSWSSDSASSRFSTAASAEPKRWVRAPSALEKASLPLVTPGHALGVLQLHGAGGENIRRADFCELCNSSRPGKIKDARVIAKGLRKFKEGNDFILHTDGARAAMTGMMRSMLPNYKVVYGKLRVDAALFVAGQFLDEKTGLYYAVEIDLIDDVLGELHKGLLEMKEKELLVPVKAANDDGDDADGEVEDDGVSKNAMRVTEDIIKLLVKRRCYPENQMKKRAARKYLTLIQVTDGPMPTTMKLASEISLMLAGPSATRERILDPYKTAWWTRGLDNGIYGKVEKAEAELVMEAAKIAAAEKEKESEDDEEVTDETASDESDVDK